MLDHITCEWMFMDASLRVLGITNCLVICFLFYFLFILIFMVHFSVVYEKMRQLVCETWQLHEIKADPWFTIYLCMCLWVLPRTGVELKRLQEQTEERNAEIINNGDPDIDSISEWSPSEGSFKEDNEKSLKNHQMTQVIPHFLNVVIILHLTLHIPRQPQSDWALGTFHNHNIMEVIISKNHLISRKHSSKARENTLIWYWTVAACDNYDTISTRTITKTVSPNLQKPT